MIGEIRQNFTEASASVGLILATALLSDKIISKLCCSSYFTVNNERFLTNSGMPL